MEEVDEGPIEGLRGIPGEVYARTGLLREIRGMME